MMIRILWTSAICAVLLIAIDYGVMRSAAAQQPVVGASTGPSDQAVERRRSAVGITDFDVRYGSTRLGDPGHAYPGYISADGRTFYRWRGVAVNISDVPFNGLGLRVPPLDLDVPGITIATCDPPVFLIKTRDGIIAPAYYDDVSRTLFRWKGVTINLPKDLPQADLGAMLIDATQRYRVIEVSPPLSAEIK